MSVESCSNESNVEFTQQEECEFESIWQGRVVSKHSAGLESAQNRIENALQDAKPHIAAASKRADHIEKQLFFLANLRDPYNKHGFPLDHRLEDLGYSLWGRNIEYIGDEFDEEPGFFDSPYHPMIYLDQPNDFFFAENHYPNNAIVLQCGFKKSFKKGCHNVGKFWRKHKVEIIIGAVAVTAIVIVAVVLPPAAGAVATASGAALDKLCNDRDDHPQTTPDNLCNHRDDHPSTIPNNPPLDYEASTPSSLYSIQHPNENFPQTENNGPYNKFPNTLTENNSPSSRESSRDKEWNQILNDPYLTERNIKPSATFTPPPSEPFPSFLQPPPLFPSQLSSTTPSHSSPQMEQGPVGLPPVIPQNSPYFSTPAPIDPPKEKIPKIFFPIVAEDPVIPHWEQDPISHKLPTLGTPNKNLKITSSNGMNTSIDEARGHQEYLKGLVPGDYPVDFIYNSSHGVTVDLVEIFSCNYPGWSPNIANLYKEEWINFHELHKDNPNRKILHICYSQSAIHTYNALASLPEEITDRLLIINLAGAKIIPERMCYKSFNYASKNDIIHYGELLHGGFFDSNETGTSYHMQTLIEDREELILLDPHPDAKGIDHNYRTPTFRKPIENHLKTYIQLGGEYPENYEMLNKTSESNSKTRIHPFEAL